MERIAASILLELIIDHIENVAKDSLILDFYYGSIPQKWSVLVLLKDKLGKRQDANYLNVKPIFP